MHRITCLLILLVSALFLQAQPLRDLNFNYLYNPTFDFTVKWKVIRLDDQIEIFYEIEALPAKRVSDLSIQLELRKQLSDKEGTLLYGENTLISTDGKRTGKFVIDTIWSGRFAVLKVIENDPKKAIATLFYKQIPTSNTPVLFHNNLPVLSTYIRLNDRIAIKALSDEKPFIVSRYTNEFPAASPPFSTAQARVQPVLKADAIFITKRDNPLSFSTKGLYLVQQDTSSSVGIAFRVEDDYPKLGRLESLYGPMIYICTKLEYDKLKEAGSDKSQFDKIILGITGNSDRAKIFMRNYFRRVEQANAYFSSYKEGWKTDRGMIFMIYGVPEAVYLSGDREIWEYKNDNVKDRFIFIKSSTLFDPENYVLIRDKKFRDKWYQMIDLWRKARF